MQLLISTPLHLIMLDPATGKIIPVRSGDGYYYGITSKNGRIVLTHSNGCLKYFSLRSHPRGTVNHLIQPHQVEWIDDHLLVANTGKNCLSLFDANGKLCRDVYLNAIRSDDKGKNRLGNHFNSVHRQGDKIYVVAHNYERPSEVWTLTWPNLDVVGTKTTGAGWAHNIWLGEQGMVICDLKNSALHEVDSARTIWRAEQQPRMTRGLAVSKDFIFVGCSLHNPRLERYWKDGGVWVLDRASLRTLSRIDLPGLGDVHEIRLVGEADACHNDDILVLEDIASLKSLSPIVQLAWQLRRKYPSLRRNLFPFSHLVRAAQTLRRSLIVPPSPSVKESGSIHPESVQ